MHPARIKTMKMIITTIVSWESPNPTAALMISVVKKVKNNEAPFKMPVIWAYPIGKAN